MFKILRSLKVTLYLNVVLAISVHSAYSDTGTCPTVTSAAETRFKNGIKLNLLLPSYPPAMFKLSFVGGKFRGQGFCFTWDPRRNKYRIGTPNSSQMKDFGRAGWKTLRIRVTEDNRIILVDETNLETLYISLRKAQPGVCYAVALHSKTIVRHEFVHSEEGQSCEATTQTTTIPHFTNATPTVTTSQPPPPITSALPSKTTTATTWRKYTTSVPSLSTTAFTQIREINRDTSLSFVKPTESENSSQENAHSMTEEPFDDRNIPIENDIPHLLGSKASRKKESYVFAVFLFMALHPLIIDLF